MPPDVKPPDQSVFDPKDVPDHFIGEEIPSEIAHRLMHFDDHFRLWAFRKRNRLDVRIDHDVEKRASGTGSDLQHSSTTPSHASRNQEAQPHNANNA
jgi:hypothetical protein